MMIDNVMTTKTHKKNILVCSIHYREMRMSWPAWLCRAALAIFCAMLMTQGLAQTVSQVTAEQQGQNVVVHYQLLTETPCEVSLLVSLDRGNTWSEPLGHCTGDLGENIGTGAHSITWNVLADRTELWGDGIRFRVKASGKKTYEPEMVLVEGGTFMMGSNSGEDDEKPVNEVTLSSFSIGKYEVTQAQWLAVMGNNPSYFSGCDNCAVEQVTWDDVQKYISKLNSMSGKTYRLPTEAEWEYAARGGKQSRNYTYSGSDDIGAVAWYDGNSGTKTHEVGKKSPNALGIYDMSGNVYEWCVDWYGSYSNRSSVNPTGASSGHYRVVRGGNWNRSPQYCRVAFRYNNPPVFRSNSLGFRLVLVPAR